MLSIKAVIPYFTEYVQFYMNGMNWNVTALTRHDTRCTELSSKGEAVTTQTGDTRDKVIRPRL